MSTLANRSAPPRLERAGRAVSCFSVVLLGLACTSGPVHADQQSPRSQEPVVEFDFQLKKRTSQGLRSLWSRADGFMAGGGFRDMGDLDGPNWDALVVGLTPDGNLAWQTIINDPGAADYISDGIANEDGSTFVSGNLGMHVDYSGAGEPDRGFLARLDQAGRVVWKTDLGTDGAPHQVHAIDLLPDGSLVAVGQTGDYGSRQLFVARLDAANGKPLMETTISGLPGEDHYGVDVKSVGNGVFRVLGNLLYETIPTWFELPVNAQGEPVMRELRMGERIAGGVRATSFTITKDSETIIAGWREPSTQSGSEGYLAKFMKDGAKVWEDYYSGTGNYSLYDVAVLPSGTVVAVGEHMTTNAAGLAASTPLVLRRSREGRLKRDETFVPPRGGALYQVIGQKNDRLLVGGDRSDDHVFTDVWVLQYRP